MPWWRRAEPVLLSLAVLVPVLALTGFVTEGRRIAAAFADPAQAQGLMELYRWPEGEAFAKMVDWKDYGLKAFWALLGISVAAYLLRRALLRRKSVRIAYTDGPQIVVPRGLTLLEMSRVAGVPHTSLCGGKGRCTTCRVVIETGAEHLHPPERTEAESLAAVGAAAGTRLACQIRPTEPLTVFRVFQPDGRTRRAHASSGEERQLALLFLDMRGFTARTAGQLPYDVVFLLNRFFDAIVPSILAQGGSVDKYLGDGLLAVFDRPDARASARAGLAAVAGIGQALERFNEVLAAEGAAPVRIGIGLHVGDIVLGEIGAAGRAPRTIIGEAVNTASRLEARTKDLGVELLVSEALLRCADVRLDGLELIALDLRGVDVPVRAVAATDLRALPWTEIPA
jgi:adenylate cyclase